MVGILERFRHSFIPPSLQQQLENVIETRLAILQVGLCFEFDGKGLDGTEWLNRNTQRGNCMLRNLQMFALKRKTANRVYWQMLELSHFSLRKESLFECGAEVFSAKGKG